MKQKFVDEQFELAATIPAKWALQAHSLKKGADILFKKVDDDLRILMSETSTNKPQNFEAGLISVASLLFGLAMENILKAVILNELPDDEKKIIIKKWPGDGHNQILLANKAKINLTEIEKDILRRLSEFVRWAGRYPIPKSADKMTIPQLGVFPNFFPVPLSPFHVTHFNKLYMKLESLVIIWKDT